MVSNVSVDVGIGSPIPVDAFISGEWPDLCAQLAQITQHFDGTNIEITLLATAADPACPPDYLGLPFRIAIPINIVQLAEGAYTVTANGATTSFIVSVTPPAAPPETQGGAAPSAPTAVPPVATVAPGAPVPTAPPPATTVASAGAQHYQGPNPYRDAPRFDVAYEAAIWEYVENDGSGRQSQLKHRMLDGCALWLRAGPVDATPVANVWLAGREWTIAQVGPDIIQYSAPEGDIGWLFGVLLPEPYSGRGNSDCQDAAERVIDTFQVAM